jgi:hypothetical protein
MSGISQGSKLPNASVDKLISEANQTPAASVNFSFMNTNLTDSNKATINGLKSKSSSVSDYIDNILELGKRSSSVSQIDFFVNDNSNYEILFSRPSFYKIFTNSKGLNTQLSVFGLFSFFDKAQFGLFAKLPAQGKITWPRSVKSFFNYNLPFNLESDSDFFKLSFFNVNTHKFKNQNILLKKIIKGLEVDRNHTKYSLYVKENLEASKDSVKDKMTFRIFSKLPSITGVVLDAKVSVDKSKNFTYKAFAYSDHIAYLNFSKAVMFIANNTALGFSSAYDLKPAKSQRFYNFSEDKQLWRRAITSYNRFGLVSKVGYIHYSIYMFGSLQAFQKSSGFDWAWNYGIGNRFLFSNNFAMEVLLNLNNRDNERRITTKFLFFD